MRKAMWYLRAAALLPLATFNYLRQQGRAGWAVIAGVPLVLLALIVGLTVHHRSARADAAVQTESVQQAESALDAAPAEAPSPTPTPTPTPEPVSLTLTFAGDCTMGMDDSMGYSGSFNETYDLEGPEYFLANVKDIFQEDDLTIVNFEGALTDSEEKEYKSFNFKGDPAYTAALTAGSVEVANVANNHSHDYGDQGFQDTKAALDQAGIVNFGYEDVAIVEVNGVKVGFTGQFTVYEDPQHLEDLKRNIETLQDQGAELIVACFHWGLENDYTPEADQVELAHAAIDAGAHLVIGHHPHVLQGVEIYQGRYIVYSLGNFCFGGNGNPPDFDCMIFRQTFTLQGTEVLPEDNVEIIPCSISSTSSYNNYQPTPAEGDSADRIFAKLRDISDGLGDENIFDTLS